MRVRVGMVSASATPAMVEWIPDWCTKNHSTTPSTRYGVSHMTRIMFSATSPPSARAANPRAVPSTAAV